MPVLALWGKQGVIEALFDCLADWREVATTCAAARSPAATSSRRSKPARAARRAAPVPENRLSENAFDFSPLSASACSRNKKRVY